MYGANTPSDDAKCKNKAAILFLIGNKLHIVSPTNQSNVKCLRVIFECIHTTQIFILFVILIGILDLINQHIFHFYHQNRRGCLKMSNIHTRSIQCSSSEMASRNFVLFFHAQNIKYDLGMKHVFSQFQYLLRRQIGSHNIFCSCTRKRQRISILFKIQYYAIFLVYVHLIMSDFKLGQIWTISGHFSALGKHILP